MPPASSAAYAADRLGAGKVRDIIIEADKLTYLASQIVPGYYAVLGVGPNGNLGRARFAVRQMVSRLQTERIERDDPCEVNRDRLEAIGGALGAGAR